MATTRFPLVAMFCWVSLCFTRAATARAEVQWRNGPTTSGMYAAISSAGTDGFAPAAPAEVASAIERLANGYSCRHLAIQFQHPVTDEIRAQCAAAGVDLLRPLGSNAFFAGVSEDQLNRAALAAMSDLRAVQPIARSHKLHPLLLRDEFPGYAVVGRTAEKPGGCQADIVAVYAQFHSDIALGDAAAAAIRIAATVRAEVSTIHVLVLELPRTSISALADLDEVQWIEPVLPRLGESNDGVRQVTQADAVQAPPYDLDGNGVSVLVYDSGNVLASHLDFGGRVHTRDSTGAETHATHVAGTIGGNGAASGGQYRGMAPAVAIESYTFEYDGQGTFFYTNPGDIQHDFNEAVNTHGVDISNTSLGTNAASNGYPCEIQGDYCVTAALIDGIARGSLGRPLRMVWANGNERGSSRCNTEGFGQYYSMAPPSCAKNPIFVGAVNSNNDSMTDFSSWGPCDDGRIKPDVCAPGCQSGGDQGVTSCSAGGLYTVSCGTSMASPAVCGLSSLLLQDYRAQFPGKPDFLNCTLKALLAHNARDLGNPGPDYQFGYGSVRIQDTIEFLRSGNFVEGEVRQSEVRTLRVLVNPGDAVLKVTLAWDDASGTFNVNPALVNDLDLRVYDPSHVQHFPWTLAPTIPSAAAQQSVADHVNVMEQVQVNAPAAGVWTIEIAGTNVPSGPQTFGLCASPHLSTCSSRGVVALLRSAYSCSDTAEIQVVDCDLNLSDETIQTVQATIASSSQPRPVTVLLTETAPASAEFRGNIVLTDGGAPNQVRVMDGDTLTATYVDGNDGNGGTNVPVAAEATIDCRGPVISNLRISRLTVDGATVSFDTSEPAIGAIRSGTDCTSLAQSASESTPTTAHDLVLSGLGGRRQFFAVDATDLLNNLTTEENGGACHSFTLPTAVYTFPLNVNPGWTTQGQWAFGHPTGSGSLNRDPSAGHTGTNVFGYNLGGDYVNNLPAAYLTTNAIDCTGLTNVNLRFWRWLGVESNSDYDEATVEASTDGTSWTVLWRATDTGADIADTSWQVQDFDLSAVADNQPVVYVRWGMGPTDGGLTYPGWNIDDVQIYANRQPLSITLPDGPPTFLSTAGPTSFRVRITDQTETYVPGTGLLWYRLSGSAYQSAALVPAGNGLYRAAMPPARCADTPRFYITALGSGGSTVSLPPDGALAAYSASAGTLSVVLDDDFQTDRGWTSVNAGATSGQWQRGVPVNDSSWEYDSASDADGSGQCWLTQNQLGNTDVDNGAVALLSPTLDLSAGGVTIAYDYYLRLTNTSGAADRLLVEFNSDNGAGPWVEIARHDTDGGLSWRRHTITQADLDASAIVMTATMKLRFTANDSGEQSIVEAGLDGVVITTLACHDAASCPTAPGDMDGNGAINGADIAGFVQAVRTAFNPCADVAAPFDILDAMDVVTFVNLLLRQ